MNVGRVNPVSSTPNRSRCRPCRNVLVWVMLFGRLRPSVSAEVTQVDHAALLNDRRMR